MERDDAVSEDDEDTTSFGEVVSFVKRVGEEGSWKAEKSCGSDVVHGRGGVGEAEACSSFMVGNGGKGRECRCGGGTISSLG